MAIKPKTACINLGYYQIKANDEMCFLSKAQETEDTTGSQGDVLELDDKKYILGMGNALLAGDKTNSPLTKVFVLTALSKMLNDEQEGIFNVLITAPPFAYEQQKEALPKFLSGEYQITYNGKPKKITIKNVVVFPETFIIYIVNSPAKLAKENVIIFDIGGKTTNICRLNKCQFTIENDYIPMKKGMYNIDSNIAAMLTNRFIDETYSDEDIADMRKYNKPQWKENLDLAEAAYRKHIKEMKYEVDIKDWNISNSKILVCGGGGKDLIDYTKEIFPSAELSNDPIFDNQKALQVFAKELFGNA